MNKLNIIIYEYNYTSTDIISDIAKICSVFNYQNRIVSKKPNYNDI